MTFTKTNASLVRRYVVEFALIALTGAVVTLYFKVDSLNVFIRENLIQQSNAAQKALQENTNALNNFYYNHETFKR